MDLYVRVRRACMVEGMSSREAARVFGLHRDTVRKMLEHSVPPGYRRQSPPRRPKLDPYRGVIDRILEEDRSLPKKQRHTAKGSVCLWSSSHSQRAMVESLIHPKQTEPYGRFTSPIGSVSFESMGMATAVPFASVSRVPGSGVRRGSGERETTASSLAGKH